MADGKNLSSVVKEEASRLRSGWMIRSSCARTWGSREAGMETGCQLPRGCVQRPAEEELGENSGEPGRPLKSMDFPERGEGLEAARVGR